MYLLAWSVNHGMNDIDDFYILCETQREAELEMLRLQETDYSLHCAAISKVIKATEPQWET